MSEISVCILNSSFDNENRYQRFRTCSSVIVNDFSFQTRSSKREIKVENLKRNRKQFVVENKRNNIFILIVEVPLNDQQ